ncbi:MAG: hypothetical protein R3F59_28770 [Myxococcota bacterium]
MRNVKAARVGIAAAVVLGLGLACSGMDLPSGGGSSANVEACKQYVEAFNGAACNQVDLNAADLCPDTLNMSPCDLSPYYKCMADAVKCNGDFLDISGQANCSMPTCN